MAKTVITPDFLTPLSAAWFEWRIGGARQGAANTAVDSRPFINCVRDLKQHRAWEKYFRDGAKTWERFCKEVLETEPAFVDQVQLGVEALESAKHVGPIPEGQALDAAARVQARAENAPMLNQNGGDRKSERAKSVSSYNTDYQGTSAEYLTRRIARDRPDIHERMKAGEYKSVRAAAKDAGIIREPTAIEKAQKLWLKMTAKERAAFQKWVKEQ